MSRTFDSQFFSAEGEAMHEIAHIVRFENSIYNKIPISEKYLPTEEGLATYVNDLSKRGDASAFQHACEYLSGKVAVNGSMRDVFNFFVSKGFNRELAWQRGIRHKFGIKDTSKPGGIVKPAMYFAKKMEVKNLSLDEQTRLFCGKISLDELDQFQSYKGRFDKELIQLYFLTKHT